VPRRRSLAPRFGPSTVDLLLLPEDPGDVPAHGIEDFPRYVTAVVQDPDLPYGVVMHVHTGADGRSSATGVQVAPHGSLDAPLPGVTAVLEDMRLNDFVAEAVGLAVLHRERLRGSGTASGLGDVLSLARAVRASHSYEPRRYNRRSSVLLEEVARVYREAFEAGKNPTAAVQAIRPPTGYSTAAAWVRQARKAGLLPPAVKGRPGWKDEA
jgi:hypothetical protein